MAPPDVSTTSNIVDGAVGALATMDLPMPACLKQ
jgi:hypothetical protein